MRTTEMIWQNGQLIPWAEAKIHVLSHTLHYGGGAFEGIRFYHTDKGPALFRLADHVDRLIYSAKALHMEIPYSKDDIINAIKEVVRINKLESGYVRPLVFYGYGKMGVNPIGCPVELIIACWPWGAYLAHDHVDVKTSRYIRIHPNSTVVNAKICGHYVNSILASLELQGSHFHEALFLDSDGYISEGVGENFFMVKKGVIYTPRIGTILNGITRDTVIKLAAKHQFKLVETDIKLSKAYRADEAFFTGTAAEVTAIHSIDDKVIGDGKIGPITTIIKDEYFNVVRGKNPEWMNFLTVI